MQTNFSSDNENSPKELDEKTITDVNDIVSFSWKGKHFTDDEKSEVMENLKIV